MAAPFRVCHSKKTHMNNLEIVLRPGLESETLGLQNYGTDHRATAIMEPYTIGDKIHVHCRLFKTQQGVTFRTKWQRKQQMGSLVWINCFKLNCDLFIPVTWSSFQKLFWESDWGFCESSEVILFQCCMFQYSYCIFFFFFSSAGCCCKQEICLINILWEKSNAVYAFFVKNQST